MEVADRLMIITGRCFRVIFIYNLVFNQSLAVVWPGRWTLRAAPYSVPKTGDQPRAASARSHRDNQMSLRFVQLLGLISEL